MSFSRPSLIEAPRAPAVRGCVPPNFSRRVIPRGVVRRASSCIAGHGHALQRQPLRLVFFGLLEDDDWPGRFGCDGFLVGLQGIVLTRDRIQHGIFIAFAKIVDPALRLQELGIDRGGTRSVGIDFTPDVVALFLKLGNHLVCKAPAVVVEVQNDRRGAKRHGVGDEFLRAVVLGRVGAERIAGMGTGRAAIACTDFLHLVHLA